MESGHLFTHSILTDCTSPATWTRLWNVYRRLEDSGYAEAGLIFRRLGDMRAFSIVFSVPGQAESVPMNVTDWLVEVGRDSTAIELTDHIVARGNVAQYHSLIAENELVQENLRRSIAQSHMHLNATMLAESGPQDEVLALERRKMLAEIDRGT